ncbi:ML domain-containing protein [Limtongia smithiae]|uniref:ML domain-containing protein n=1 Tax=Limtongia smithiae TaxID=1125753 RepID=UPI0034CD127A
MKFAYASLLLAAVAAALAPNQQAPLPFDDEVSLLAQAPTRPVPGKSPVAICDLDAPQLLDIKYLKISPNPPVKGAELYIEGEGVLAEAVAEGAFVEVEVRYGFIRLVKETIDLCEQLEKADRACPLEKGVIKFAKSVELPGEIPPGKYNVIARAYKDDYSEITCLTAAVEFPRA